MRQTIWRDAHAQIGSTAGLAERGFEADDLAEIRILADAAQTAEVTEGDLFFQADVSEVIAAERHQRRCLVDQTHQGAATGGKGQIRTRVVHAVQHLTAERFAERADQCHVRRAVDGTSDQTDAATTLECCADRGIEFAPRHVGVALL